MVAKSRPLNARERQKTESHERILESASRLVKRTGLGAASVPRVMRGAGLTVGGFYAHFRSKEAFGVLVLDRYADRIDAIMCETLGDESIAPAIFRRYSSPSRRRSAPP